MVDPATLTDTFVQVIEAPVADAEQVRAVYHRWFDELAPDAEGWLTATAGITDDGEFVAVVQFASEEAARRNSQREAQDAWWNELSGHLAGEARFHESDEVAAFGENRSDDAGFVHLVRGRAVGLAGVTALVAEHEHHHIHEHHLPVLGGMLATHGEERFTELVYYPSADEVRDADGRLPDESVTMVERVADDLLEVQHRYVEDPWLHRH